MDKKYRYEDWQIVEMVANDSGKQQYRYILSANITDKEEIENPLVVLGINPSTADTASADPTINSVKKLLNSIKYMMDL